jgi:hypothetical protein
MLNATLRIRTEDVSEASVQNVADGTRLRSGHCLL